MAEPVPVADRMDYESRRWIERLRDPGRDRDVAIAELQELLLRAARFEVRRRCATMSQIRGGDQEDLAEQSAGDAIVAILSKLDDFRGDSRFTTWAYKFALYEAAAKIRKLAWQGRELPLAAEDWSLMADPGLAPQGEVEMNDLLAAIRQEIETSLTPHQREVLVALALNEVPIDVLADRLGSTRGALYKTLHDARRKLREALAARGLIIDERGEEK
ncbi:MAG TPA: sigma-70 family RNA polymerase sigma factor [Solirubrobacterales bacterium]|jgi:RNA polymerase sigma-70 factor (ECF subfamily)